jgi:hypothetical protein
VTEVIDGPVEPLDISTADDGAPVQGVRLFSIDGPPYYVPAVPSASLALQFMARYRADPIAGQGWVLEELLGAEAYRALAGYKQLKAKDLARLIQIALRLVMGTVEGATGPLGRR